jgi:hypothetical protein
MRSAFQVAAIAAALAASGSAGAARPVPSLTLADTQPVVLHGAHFRPRESVRVDALGTHVAVRASARGTFTVTVGQGPLPRCGARIQAVGARGSIALLKLPLPACMPAALPGRTP